MKKVFIVAAKRTAIGKFGGSLSGVDASTLGATVLRNIMSETKLADTAIDEVIMGQVLTAGCGQNPARQAAINAGISEQTPAITINKVCGSGMKAVQMAVQAIRCGDANIILAGGQESMSRSPHAFMASRSGVKFGNTELTDTMIHDGLWDAFNDYHMGITAENLAEQHNISREAQDAFAAESQKRASHAQKAGKFDKEICSVAVKVGRESLAFSQDEFIRHDATESALAKLRPAFKPDGSVTAGNASGLNDGAAALCIASEDAVQQYDLTPLVEIVSYASAGVSPSVMGIGPVPATQRCLEKAGWDVASLDLIESNEAFAAQSLAVTDKLKWPLDKVNVNGGAIALGHPIGASGARIIVTLVHAMLERKVDKGLATLCIGGGQGVALAVQRC